MSGSIHAPLRSTGEFIAGDGIRLFTTRWAPAGPTRATLLLVHGLKDHSGRYAPLAEALTAEGVAIDAFDLRGHGRSQGPRQWVRRFEEYVDDLDRFAGQVRVRGRPTFVFGHSMGGAVVVEWIRERHPDVAGVILSAPALEAPRTISPATKAVTRWLGRLTPRARLFRLPLEDFSRDPEVEQELGADPLIDPRAAPVRTGAELLRVMAGFPLAYPALDLPILALHGTEDRLTSPKGSETMVRMAGSPDKTYREYPGLYHDLLHEPERAVVLGDITRWITERAAVPGG